jgi:hypothetical protein
VFKCEIVAFCEDVGLPKTSNMKPTYLKKAQAKRVHSLAFKDGKKITSEEIKKALSKTKDLTDEQIVLIKDWLNNFMILSYRTWKQKEREKQQQEINTNNNFQTNNTEHEESHYLYSSEYRRAS